MCKFQFPVFSLHATPIFIWTFPAEITYKIDSLELFVIARSMRTDKTFSRVYLTHKYIHSDT